MWKLVLELEGSRTEKSLGPSNVTLGRAAPNDVVVPDPTVSWHHAVVWLEGGRPWIRDLGSTNGSWVNGRRLTGSEPLQPNDVIRLGHVVELRLEGDMPSLSTVRGWKLEDETAAGFVPLAGDRFYFGSGADCHLKLEGPVRAATLLIHANGEVWLGDDDGEREVTSNDAFEVCGRKFTLREAPGSHITTLSLAPTRYPYKLVVTNDTRGGPRAELSQVEHKKHLEVPDGNRAVFLWLLAKRWRDEGDRPPAARGWVEDEEVKTAVWGRKGDDNKLNVMLYRLRAQLKEAGFDPWFIEKRHRNLRLRVAEVVVVDV